MDEGECSIVRLYRSKPPTSSGFWPVAAPTAPARSKTSAQGRSNDCASRTLLLGARGNLPSRRHYGRPLTFCLKPKTYNRVPPLKRAAVDAYQTGTARRGYGMLTQGTLDGLIEPVTRIASCVAMRSFT